MGQYRQIDFEDSGSDRIESLAESLGISSDLLLNFPVELMESFERTIRDQPEDLRQWREKLKEISLSGEISDRTSRIAEIFLNCFGTLRTGEHGGEIEFQRKPGQHEGNSAIADDELLAEISQNLMIRKQELYRRLAR